METNNKLVVSPKGKEFFADSLESATEGQMVVLSNEGEVVRKSELSGSFISPKQLAPYLGVGACLGLICGVAGVSVIWPIVGSGVVGVVSVARNLRRAAHCRRILSLVAAKRFDEARAAYLLLSNKARRKERAGYQQELARLGYLAGDHTVALAHAEAAVTLHDSHNRKETSVFLHLTRTLQIDLLAVLDRLDEAEALMPELESAPSTPMMDHCVQFCSMRIAFGKNDASALASEDIYDWAKAVLATNLLGTSALVLAWTFDNLGDREMAKHMLSESPARLAIHNIEHSDPALFQFLKRAWKDWGLEEDQPFSELEF